MNRYHIPTRKEVLIDQAERFIGKGAASLVQVVIIASVIATPFAIYFA